MAPRKVKGSSRLLCFLFSLTMLIPLWLPCAQEVPSREQAVPFDSLLKEMNSALDSGGEDGLKAWIKANMNRIGDDFVLYAAQQAASQNFERLKRAADILASEKGNACLNAGNGFQKSGEDVKALAMYDKALLFFEKAHDLLGQGNACESKGEIYYYSYENAKAQSMYEKALPFFERAQDSRGQGSVCLREGNIFSRTGENAKALAMYEKALPFFEKAQRPIGQGNVYFGEGDIFFYMGENAKALVLYEKALPFFEKAQDAIGLGGVYKAEGNIFLYTGYYAKALAMYEKALPFYEKAQDPRGQGDVYKGKGTAYLFSGEHVQALALYEKALPFYEKARDHLGQGNTYMREGEILLYAGDYAKALALFEKARFFFEKAQDSRGQGNICINEGQIFLYTGDYVRALAMFEKAVSFHEKAQDPFGLCDDYQNEGSIFSQTGEHAKAMVAYEKALAFAEKIGSPLGQGSAYHGMGNIYLKRGDRTKSLEMFKKALAFFDKAGEPVGQGRVCLSQGDIYLDRGDYVQAQAFYEKAEGLFGKIGDLEDSCYAYIGKARVFSRQGRQAEALQLYEAGLENLEKIRAQTIISELKKSFMEKVYGTYDHAALFMLGNGYPERGFRIVESMKARLFLDQLAENLANVDNRLDPALKERRDTLTRKLSTLAEAMGQADEAKLAELANERSKVEAEFEDLQVEIRLKNPAYAALRYPQPVSLDDLQKKILRNGEVLVEYYLSGEKAFAFVVTKEGFKTVELPAGSKAIQSAVQGYLDWIGNPNYRPAAELNRFAAGAALYGLLLKPLESNLSEGATIIIVPDAELAKLPFESLVVSQDPASKQPVYLLEKYPVKYIQSASVLEFLRTQFKQEGVTEAFIGFGDPVYDYEHFKKNEAEKGSTQELKGDILAELNRDRFARGGGTLNRLEGSGQEVTDIMKIFQARSKSVPGKPSMNLRLDASEENAKAPAMADYGYILFSCHGLLGDGYQCLVLSQVPGAKEDGFLTLGEIMNSSYKARLVVLSACQTGQGTEERGEGVTGLTRAVMYAGSPAAVVSLWSVSDEATRELMVRFYRRMIEDGLSKDEALRRAKLEILRGAAKFQISQENSVSISHPFFWAAFVMYGE